LTSILAEITESWFQNVKRQGLTPPWRPIEPDKDSAAASETLGSIIGIAAAPQIIHEI